MFWYLFKSLLPKKSTCILHVLISKTFWITSNISCVLSKQITVIYCLKSQTKEFLHRFIQFPSIHGFHFSWEDNNFWTLDCLPWVGSEEFHSISPISVCPLSYKHLCLEPWLGVCFLQDIPKFTLSFKVLYTYFSSFESPKLEIYTGFYLYKCACNS